MRNEAKLKQWGLQDKVKFYYLKFGEVVNGQPTKGIATVCVIKTDDVMITCNNIYVRGVAFFNPDDPKLQFNRKLGRAIALGRAVKVIKSQCPAERIPKTTPAAILREELTWEWLCVPYAYLTEFEKTLFQEKKGVPNK